MSETQSDFHHRRLLTEVFISFDAEADGPCPPMNSMLSIGACAFTLERGILGTFERNLETLPGSAPDEKTMAFWAKHPQAWARTRENPDDPRQAVWDFARWANTYSPGRKIELATYPGGFDFTVLYWYCHRFLGFCPFGHACWDAKSYASAMLKLPFSFSVKRNMPKHWFTYENPLPHVGVYDAIGQAHLFINMMTEHLGIPNPLIAPVAAQ